MAGREAMGCGGRGGEGHGQRAVEWTSHETNSPPKRSHASIKPQDFRLIAGRDELGDYHFNTRQGHHRFCRHCGIAPFGDGWYRIFAWNRRNQVDDKAPVDLDEIREVTRRALGTDFGMHDPRWLSRFHSDERQAPRYRVGRVFLAGDAAHCHSPAGGQGMNTGLQDAANLSWKLAAAVHGWGGERLLDSYHEERYSVGRQVLRSSGAILRLALIRPRWAQRARNVIGQILMAIPPVATRVAGTISGVSIRYPAPPGADPRVGSRVPDIPLTGGRLHEALRGGRFVLVGTDAASGYLAWVGPAAEFPAWGREYFSRGSARRPDQGVSAKNVGK